MKYKKMNQSLMVYQEKIENQNREIQESKEKIAQQHELVQNAYDTQGKIMSIVGHDLRTPLAQIKNILELERSGALSPIEKTEIFKELERTTVASLEMLSSLVNWGKAKLQSDGSRETSAQITKVLTEECNELYSTAIHQKNIHLSFIETDNIALPISEAETAVLIRNIVYNAIKFSNTNGDIQVEIRKEHGKPTLLIRDFGIGMTPDQVRRLSEGLNIESLRGTSNEGGFGLGMWFVRDITLRNQGEFSIESEPGKGAEFKIQFSSTDPK
jgi:signal transduction histidine kinase